jgi:hypothetical protein
MGNLERLDEEPGRIVCTCPPKELDLQAENGFVHRRNTDAQVREILSTFGFNISSQVFLGNGGGLALSEGPELFNDGRVIVAFCGDLSNKMELANKVLKEEQVTENLCARLVGTLCGRLNNPHTIMGKLRGKFSFIVLDTTIVRVFAARDCSGTFPLYQSRLHDGSLVVCNYATEHCEQQIEIPPGYFVYGGRRCDFPQKFSPELAALEEAKEVAQGAVARALQGIRTKSDLLPGSRLSLRKAPRKINVAKPKPSINPVDPTVPLVTVISAEVVHKAPPQRKKNTSARADSSTWWRKPVLSAGAVPFTMPPAAMEGVDTAVSVEDSSALKATQPEISGVSTEPERIEEAVDIRERIEEAVDILHRIASSGKIQNMLALQEETNAPRSGMRRVPSCSEVDGLKRVSSLQRIPSLQQLSDLQSPKFSEAH